MAPKAEIVCVSEAFEGTMLACYAQRLGVVQTDVAELSKMGEKYGVGDGLADEIEVEVDLIQHIATLQNLISCQLSRRLLRVNGACLRPRRHPRIIALKASDDRVQQQRRTYRIRAARHDIQGHVDFRLPL